jgi:predicted Rossmann fold flavoprotein
MYNKKEQFDLVVIGGGAAGMMMAGRAASFGAKVLLLEKNRKLGKKLGISGGGRCNITNAEMDTRKLLENFGDSKKFLFSPFSQFGVKETFDFFENLNLPLVVESRKRAFPKSQSAEDVVEVMENYVRDNNAEIHMNAKVISVNKREDGLYLVKTKKGYEFVAKNIAIAAGGLAAPNTGSTGDGFKFLQTLGHRVYEPSPNIVPLTTNDEWVYELSGISLSFMKLSFIQFGKVKIKKVGKILFTHFGISGPLVLNSANEVIELLHAGPVLASIDLFPDTNEGELERRVLNLFELNKNKQLKNILGGLLPKNMVVTILSLPHLNLSAREVNSVTKEERKVLVKTIKNLQFEITGTLGYEDAVIADGGVALEEVDFKTMESKIHKGLYLLGDTLCINRPSGGYSLQMCWTTGFVAGTHVGKSLRS